MLRKLICIVASLTMLICMLSSAVAFEKLPAPTNLRWDGCIARWDEVAGARSYSIYVEFLLKDSGKRTGLSTSSSVPYYDCTDAFKSAGNSLEISQGTIYATFTVKAWTDDVENVYSSDTSAPSPETTYELQTTKETLATPLNLRWEGNVAVWDEVPNATYYSFYLKSARDESSYGSGLSTSTRETYYDCTDALKDAGASMGMTEGTIYATFTVKAQTSDYDHFFSGKESAASPQLTFELPVRERLTTPVNLRWEGTKAVWDAVPNARSYSFFLKTEGTSLSTSSSTNSYECLEAMKNAANSTGKLGEFLVFTFTVKAYSNNRDLYIDSYTSETSPKIYINPIAKDELPGDIDIDGVPGVSDARIVLQAIAKGIVSEAVRQVADVDNNGKLDANDALKIMQYSAGWNVTLK